MPGHDLVIQPSSFGWSLYMPYRPKDEALIASADDWISLAKYAIEDLDATVRICRTPELFV